MDFLYVQFQFTINLLFLLLKPIPKINFTFTLFSANNLNSFAYSSIVSLETHGTIIQTSCLALVTPV